MIGKIRHRGENGSNIVEVAGATLGFVCPATPNVLQLGYSDQAMLKLGASAPEDTPTIADKANTARMNTLIFMVNSPFALHAVSHRQPTRHIRRYINFLAEFREQVFDLNPYQDTETPWALSLHKGGGY